MSDCIDTRYNTITYQQVVNVKQDTFSLDVFEADVDFHLFDQIMLLFSFLQSASLIAQ